jgi:hypothetical protein
MNTQSNETEVTTGTVAILHVACSVNIPRSVSRFLAQHDTAVRAVWPLDPRGPEYREDPTTIISGAQARRSKLLYPAAGASGTEGVDVAGAIHD